MAKYRYDFSDRPAWHDGSIIALGLDTEIMTEETIDEFMYFWRDADLAKSESIQDEFMSLLAERIFDSLDNAIREGQLEHRDGWKISLDGRMGVTLLDYSICPINPTLICKHFINEENILSKKGEF